MKTYWLTAAVALAIGSTGCSSHPPEGTLVDPGPGIEGLPGGSRGVSADRAVPVSGGTLLIARDGKTAVAADPDRDRVWLVDLGSQRVGEVNLQHGDEPGRAAEDGAGRVHVALRRGGALLTLDPGAAEVLERRPVCPAPRGVAFDAARNLIHVACQTGELVSLPPSGGEPVRRLDLGRDLRDVIVDGSRLLVSRFRSAELLVVGASGEIERVVTPPSSDIFSGGFVPSVAWRTIALPTGGVAMLHQRANPNPIAVGPAGYYSSSDPCAGAIVHGTLSPIDPDDPPDRWTQPPVALPLMIGPSDTAVSGDGTKVAVVSIGNSWQQAPLPVLNVFEVSHIGEAQGCDEGVAGIEGEPTAVAFDGDGRVVVQSREPAQLQIVGGPTIRLTNDSRADTGIALFHMNSGFGIACASCHPEGAEDARTWDFGQIGPRRTQSIGGGLLSTAPFHWDGDMPDFTSLVHEVFVSRMGGSSPNKPQIERFERFLDRIEAPAPRTVDAAAAERGAALFADDLVGCVDCHSGKSFTNNGSYDVGTGGSFQVPSLLGVGARAPFIHDGCAPTLRDRFAAEGLGSARPACGGGDAHGRTAHLSSAQLDDLVAYLESL